MTTSFGMPAKHKVDLVEQGALTTFQLLEAERNSPPAGRRGDARSFPAHEHGWACTEVVHDNAAATPRFGECVWKQTLMKGTRWFVVRRAVTVSEHSH